MQLPLELLPAYADLTGQSQATLTALLARGRLEPALVRVAKGRGRRQPLRGAVRLVPMGDGMWIVTDVVASVTPPRRALVEALLVDAIGEVRRRLSDEQPSARVFARPGVELLDADYRAALTAAGFVDHGERVEYCTELDALPAELEAPRLRWRNLDEVGFELAAHMLERVAHGDPHAVEEAADAAEALRGFLTDRDLTCGPDCVHVGYLADRPVAFICAQIDSRDGWSRITYMGLVPAARGQGLGRELHRHGFAMLRAQGGRTYHGGTAGENLAMRRLFEAHGCQPFRHLAEWTCTVRR